VSVPNYDQVGSAASVFLYLLWTLSVFSVPAFVFVSGFFVAYAARGGGESSVWTVAGKRAVALLIPYLIWSAVIFLGEWLESCRGGCQFEPASVYLEKLLLGTASGAYYYVILIVQLYLLSPWLTAAAKRRPGVLLGVAALIQLQQHVSSYCRWLEVGWCSLTWLDFLLFRIHLFIFVLGIVCGLYLTEVKGFLKRVRPVLPAAVVVTAGLVFFENWFIVAWTAGKMIARSNLLSANLYGIAVILSFVAFETLPLPGWRLLGQIGTRMYGVFLLHVPLLELFARSVRYFLPWLLEYQIVFVLVLIGLGIGVPMVFMSGVAGSRVKRVYPYLFG
jgi:fucose 4-O-acetylase-like acetyltransferase